MKIGLASAALFLIVAASGSPALACSCKMMKASAEEFLSSSDAIFSGTVVQTRPTGNRQAVTTFRIDESFKGPAKGAIIRLNHRSGPSPACGVNFSRGDTVTLAVSKDGRDWSGSLCSTVGLEDEVLEKLRELRGKK